MDYSPWSSKNIINGNWLKKFMQVGIDVKCMHTIFGECDFFGFGDYGYPSKMTKFPFWGMDYSPWSSKNLIDRNRLKKFMQVGIDVKRMNTIFGGCGFFGFGDMATLQKQPNFPYGAWTIVHGHRKI